MWICARADANAVDAITARQLVDPSAVGEVWFEPAEVTGGGTSRVHATGIGLTEQQVHELLATIGRSSNGEEQWLSTQLVTELAAL